MRSSFLPDKGLVRLRYQAPPWSRSPRPELAEACGRLARHALRHGRHRVPARDHLLSDALRRADGEPGRSGGGRCARERDRSAAVLRADGERAGDEGVSRRPAGHRNRLAPGRHHPARRCSTRRSPPWCSATAIRSPTTSWCSASPATARQVAPLHRLDAPAAVSPAQIDYAVSDVTHLRDVYSKLTADLDERAAPNGCARRWRC